MAQQRKPSLGSAAFEFENCGDVKVVACTSTGFDIGVRATDTNGLDVVDFIAIDALKAVHATRSNDINLHRIHALIRQNTPHLSSAEKQALADAVKQPGHDGERLKKVSSSLLKLGISLPKVANDWIKLSEYLRGFF